MVEDKYRHFLANNRYPRQLIQYKSDDKSAVHLTYEGKSILNFSSNDYLGLSRHPLLITRSQEYAKKFGVGASSSRLVAGNLAIVHQLEEQLAYSLRKPAALILGSGYQTNFTVLEALLDKQALGEQPIVFCDKFLHASMILSIRHHAEVKRFKHNDLTHLESLLIAQAKNKQPKFILVESLYSMDGDSVDLKRLISLAKQYEAMLYVDDAHCVGVYGPNGWGSAAEYPEDIDIIMGTFSKGLGSFGGYITCSNTIKDYLVNRCKGLIYSTALPAPVLGAISAALELVPELESRRQKLLQQSKKLLAFFQKNNLNCGPSQSHIIPWIIGDAEKTLYVSELLIKENILGVSIRPPSVSIGQSRIRFCLTAAHEEAHIEQLMDALLKVVNDINI